jgi:hypothetical protein
MEDQRRVEASLDLEHVGLDAADVMRLRLRQQLHQRSQLHLTSTSEPVQMGRTLLFSVVCCVLCAVCCVWWWYPKGYADGLGRIAARTRSAHVLREEMTKQSKCGALETADDERPERIAILVEEPRRLIHHL